MPAAGPSRRALLNGRLTSKPAQADLPFVHISSAIVSVLPNRRDEILDHLSALPGVEIHHAEAFKIVLVLEADNAGALGSRLAEIAALEGVLSANMVFEQATQLSDIREPT